MRCLTVVRFPAPAGLDDATLRRILEDSAPRYRGIPGLHRKYFISDATTGGGVYEWETRDVAMMFYDTAWHERMKTVYGVTPDLLFFDVRALVDNDADAVLID
ncbi:MAG: hypothetical protein KA224_04665 [Steroidobacteraceae bacterium]|nr:hypothetical protein [Steroidobacteraceae bacterium]